MDGATTHGYDILRVSGRKGVTMSVRMFQARLECDRETLGRLWLTHRVFNERLPAIISVLFKMRRGECGRNKQERSLYQRMARFFLAMDSKNADYLLNSISIRNWTPNTALKMKATVRDAAGPAARGPTLGSSRGSKSNCRAGSRPAAPADRGKGNEKIGIVPRIPSPEFPRISFCESPNGAFASSHGALARGTGCHKRVCCWHVVGALSRAIERRFSRPAGAKNNKGKR
jgi:hypothetical protein